MATAKKAVKWWARSWNNNLESYSDYSNRLPRARTYFRAGNVKEIDISEGYVFAKVKGSKPRPYKVSIYFDEFDEKRLKKISDILNGKIEK